MSRISITRKYQIEKSSFNFTFHPSDDAQKMGKLGARRLAVLPARKGRVVVIVRKTAGVFSQIQQIPAKPAYRHLVRTGPAGGGSRLKAGRGRQ
jgi:hypothetical protein